MVLAGAETRIQLGYAAARRGWAGEAADPAEEAFAGRRRRCGRPSSRRTTALPSGLTPLSPGRAVVDVPAIQVGPHTGCGGSGRARPPNKVDTACCGAATPRCNDACAAGTRRWILWNMAPRTTRSALAGVIGMIIVGCGGDPDRATSPQDVATTVAPPGLDEYLLRVDEVPGLEPMVVAADPLGGTLRSVRRRLRAASAQWLPLDDEPDRLRGDRGGGVSSALLFETEAGARDWMVYETSDTVIRDQFLPDAQDHAVPGSRRPWRPRSYWTGPARQRHRPRLLDPGSLHDAHRHRGQGTTCRAAVGRGPGDPRAHRRHLPGLILRRPRGTPTSTEPCSSAGLSPVKGAPHCLDQLVAGSQEEDGEARPASGGPRSTALHRTPVARRGNRARRAMSPAWVDRPPQRTNTPAVASATISNPMKRPWLGSTKRLPRVPDERERQDDLGKGSRSSPSPPRGTSCSRPPRTGTC